MSYGMSASLSYSMSGKSTAASRHTMALTTVTRQAIESRTAERVVSDALNILQLTQEDLAAALKVSPRTVRRWQAGGHVPQKDSRSELQDMQRFLYLLTRTVPPNAAPRWARTPLPHLKGRTPLAVLQEGKLGELLRLVAAVDSGAFL